MKYDLYQVRPERVAAGMAFMPLGTRIIDATDYERTYYGDVPATREMTVLNALFRTFNVAHPDDFTGRSMSVSDVVVLDGDTVWYCDNLGWSQLPDHRVTGKFRP